MSDDPGQSLTVKVKVLGYFDGITLAIDEQREKAYYKGKIGVAGTVAEIERNRLVFRTDAEWDELDSHFWS